MVLTYGVDNTVKPVFNSHPWDLKIVRSLEGFQSKLNLIWPALGWQLMGGGHCSQVVVYTGLTIYFLYFLGLVFFNFFCSFLPLTPRWLIYLSLSQEQVVFFYFFPLTYTLDLLAATLHIHKCTKAHLDFDPQQLSVIVYVSIKSLFSIETIQLKLVKVLKS